MLRPSSRCRAQKRGYSVLPSNAVRSVTEEGYSFLPSNAVRSVTELPLLLPPRCLLDSAQSLEKAEAGFCRTKGCQVKPSIISRPARASTRCVGWDKSDPSQGCAGHLLPDPQDATWRGATVHTLAIPAESLVKVAPSAKLTFSRLRGLSNSSNRPASRIRTLSESMIVCSRCAIVRVVQSANEDLMVLCKQPDRGQRPRLLRLRICIAALTGDCRQRRQGLTWISASVAGSTLLVASS